METDDKKPKGLLTSNPDPKPGQEQLDSRPDDTGKAADPKGPDAEKPGLLLG